MPPGPRRAARRSAQLVEAGGVCGGAGPQAGTSGKRVRVDLLQPATAATPDERERPLRQLGLELGGGGAVDEVASRVPGRRPPRVRRSGRCRRRRRPSSSRAPASSVGSGRQVLPLRSASDSRWTSAARGRPGGSPSPAVAAIAIRSAIANPTPNTRVSSYGLCATTRCAVGPYSVAIRGRGRRGRAAPAAGAAGG